MTDEEADQIIVLLLVDQGAGLKWMLKESPTRLVLLENDNHGSRNDE